MSINLYEISTELAVIQNEIAAAGGEIDDAIESRLDQLSLTAKDKVESITRWTLNLDSNVSAIDNEIARLQHKKQTANNLSDRLKEYVKACMSIADISKLEYTLFNVAVQKNPASVEVVDAEAVPAEYKTVRQTVSIDKTRVLKDLKLGQVIEGCRLISDKTHLRIK